MRWLKRGLWITAWGVWAWLGMGLYHQLPRKTGPASCTLSYGRDSTQLGFIGDTNRFAMLHAMGTNRARISIYDVSNGSVVQEMPWKWSMLPSGVLPKNTDDPMLVLANDIDGKSASAGLSVCELDSLKWRRISDSPNQLFPVAVDAENMIGLCISHGTTPKQIQFFDLLTGAELIAQEVPKGWSFNGAAFDDPSHGFIAYSMGKSELSDATDHQNESAQKLEVWKVGRPPARVATVAFSRLEVPISASRNGRIAFTRIGTQAPFRVFDVAHQVWIFERQVANEPPYDPKNQGVANEPLISPSGRAALDGTWSSLWDIESGRLLWSKKEHEVVRADRRDVTFLVREQWSRFLPKSFPSLPFETCALRDLETGDLIVRTSGKEFSVPLKMNISRSLAALKDGTVYLLPFPVNWALLALCQAVLALPIMLLWLALVWRRRRRLRRLCGATV